MRVESDWTPTRLKAAITFVVERVRADVGPVAGVAVDGVVSVRLEPGWAEETTTSPGNAGVEDAVAVVLGGRHEFPLGLEEGVEYGCWLLADQVQDDVIGELGRPWPEVRRASGTSLGVLEAALVGGLAVWTLRGDPICAIGHLDGALRASGLEVVPKV